MEIFILWIGLAAVVGVAANTRGRNGFGWFLLAVVLSPLVAGLLVLALPQLAPFAGEPVIVRNEPIPLATQQVTNAPFEPEGVFAGVPYKVVEAGAVMAVLSGATVRFKNMEQFMAAATGKTASPERGP
jgi:hypothetical protein